jgi:peptide/nickel transport system permease protein
MFGFVLFAVLLLFIFIYPLFNPGDPLATPGRGTFFKPGLYVSLYDSLETPIVYTLVFSDDEKNERRIDAKLRSEDRESMKKWLILYGIAEEEIDINDTESLMGLWNENYTPEVWIDGLLNHERNFYRNLDRRLDGLLNFNDLYVMMEDPAAEGELIPYNFVTRASDIANNNRNTIQSNDYINVGDVVNTYRLPLGTDNFGSDMLKKLVSATKTSLMMGLIGGIVATLLGLLLGLLAGYVGGWLDDAFMFIFNIFTVIPGFVLLILISYSIGQEQRGAMTVAIVIGLTSWVWTARSVRAQVISLRNRDHVNLSKLSGHSLPRIIARDILPYIASYVVMAFILQISSAILAEAGLSMLGLGPKTTDTATLGLMMNWAMRFTAHLQGAWWAYYPVVLVIATISFSLNLMNTGLDQIFNPQLRD